MSKEKIYEILSEIQPSFNFKTSSNFIEDGLLDSFDIVQLVSELEKVFDIRISALDILPENFNSVDAIDELIHKK